MEAIRCMCGTPYREATGHRLSEVTVLCGPCARSFVGFVKFQMTRTTRAGIDANGKTVRVKLSRAGAVAKRAISGVVRFLEAARSFARVDMRNGCV